MDLAKIRKKALLIQVDSVAEGKMTPSALPESFKDLPEAIPAGPASPTADSLSIEPDYTSFAPKVAAPQLNTDVLPDPMYTPLEAIMAGRSAAGCDAEFIDADESTNVLIAESSKEFLCFRVSDEIYGINIMDIKEIIKPRVVTEVPRAPLFVSGVLSLRGTIIPIIDMRVRLGLAREEPTGKERIVVIRILNSYSGLLVDEVIQVVRIPLEAVEDVPTVLEGIDREFISGLGRSDGRLIIILNLENIADINLY